MENPLHAIIGGVGMLFSSFVSKSVNSLEKIKPRMMCASFNGKSSTTIFFFYSFANASDEKDIISFYSTLSSLVRHIPKHDN